MNPKSFTSKKENKSTMEIPQKLISCILLLLAFLLQRFDPSLAGLLTERAEPLNPANFSGPSTVPAFPVQTGLQMCSLDLTEELFGGVNEACGRDLDRNRCCPVLAAWLFAAHARSALEVESAAPASSDLPMMPDDSQKCVDSLQNSLNGRNIRIHQPNASCDPVLCFCGIRLHQITSLSCPAAFNVTSQRVATPTAAVKNLERNCRNSTYAGCSKCLGALQKLNGDSKNRSGAGDQVFNRDCQLMGLTWLLTRNKTAYIPTVSAVLRAVMYGSQEPHEQLKCSPDRENMPLAVDSLEFENSCSPPPSTPNTLVGGGVRFTTILPLMALLLVLQ